MVAQARVVTASQASADGRRRHGVGGIRLGAGRRSLGVRERCVRRHQVAMTTSCGPPLDQERPLMSAAPLRARVYISQVLYNLIQHRIQQNSCITRYTAPTHCPTELYRLYSIQRLYSIYILYILYSIQRLYSVYIIHRYTPPLCCMGAKERELIGR